jgi:hypothetical protein
MPISEKIRTQVEKTEATPAQKGLMMEILQLEDKGSYRYRTEYESLIKKYIDENEEAKK